MKTLIAIAVLMLAAVAHSHDVQIPYQHIADYTSNQGETEIQFMKRIGKEMHAYSQANGVETCGVIGKSASGYSIILGTNLSHIGCIFLHDHLIAGYTDSGDVIHSHIPDNKTYILSPVDAIMAHIPMPAEQTRIKIDSSSHFSKWDFDPPSGYLATPNGLIHESGKVGIEKKVL